MSESEDTGKYQVDNDGPVQGQVIGDNPIVHQYFRTQDKATSPTKPQHVWVYNRIMVYLIAIVLIISILVASSFIYFQGLGHTPPPTAEICYGSSHKLPITVGKTPIQDIERTKTENCQDINVRFTTLPHPVMVQVCFVTNSWCGIHDDPNGWVTFQQPSFWKAVVTDIRPTTKFFLKFKSADASSAPFPVTAEIAY